MNQALPNQADDVAAGMVAGPGLGLHVETPRPDVRVVRVAGELDLHTSPRLAECLRAELAPRPAHLIIDLARVSYLGSAGLQVLVDTRAAAESGHSQLGLAGVSAAVVRRPLELTGLIPLFTCYDTVAQALAELV